MRPDTTTRKRSARAEAKRELIVGCAMRYFAEDGLQGARIEDMALELGIAKGSIFQHYGSKAGLFLACYKRAVAALPAWLDAPAEVQEAGFFSVVRYWLDRTEHYVEDDRIPYRVVLIGNYSTDLELRRDINRWLVSEDPYGTLEFVEWGQRRGEVRMDVDLETIVSLVDWLSGRSRTHSSPRSSTPVCSTDGGTSPRTADARGYDFGVLLRSAIGTADGITPGTGG